MEDDQMQATQHSEEEGKKGRTQKYNRIPWHKVLLGPGLASQTASTTKGFASASRSSGCAVVQWAGARCAGLSHLSNSIRGMQGVRLAIL
jgi:hypothetical protein